MVIDHRYSHLQVVRSSIGTTIRPLLYLANVPAALSDWAGESFASRADLIAKNQYLNEQALYNQAKLQRLALLERENERLRQLLDSPAQNSQEKVLIAEILAVNLHPFKQIIAINKGKQHGVYLGQPVVGAKGIIGQVAEIFPFHANILLISDPNHALLAESNRTNLRALLVGSGDVNRVQLKNVSQSADIKQGDLFHTSGLDGLYPPNYPIAEVTSISNNPGEPFLQVEARPLADLDTIREVLLLWIDSNDILIGPSEDLAN